MSFKAYIENVEAKLDKSRDEIFKIAIEKSFITNGKISATHKQLLEWLKSDMGLRHVHANFVIAYLKLRTHDPSINEKMKNWAYSTGYKESE
jgi:hypothetical protein